MLADPCADPGIFARVVQARLPENSSDNGFCLFVCPQLLQFYSGFSMVYFKENYNFTRFSGRGGGGGGGGGGGIRTCDHLRGSRWEGSGIHYSLKI